MTVISYNIKVYNVRCVYDSHFVFYLNNYCGIFFM